MPRYCLLLADLARCTTRSLSLQALAGQPGVEGVTLGRSVEEKRTVSQVGGCVGPWREDTDHQLWAFQ